MGNRMIAYYPKMLVDGKPLIVMHFTLDLNIITIYYNNTKELCSLVNNTFIFRDYEFDISKYLEKTKENFTNSSIDKNYLVMFANSYAKIIMPYKEVAYRIPYTSNNISMNNHNTYVQPIEFNQIKSEFHKYENTSVKEKFWLDNAEKFI